jgi:hypothetical protein
MVSTVGSWRRLLALLLVGALAAALGGLQIRSASAAPPAPAEIRLDSITSVVEAPVGTPSTAVPSVLVVADQEITVTVSFYDTLQRPAYFSKDTRVVVSSDQGAVTSIETVARKGAHTASLRVSVPTPTNQVRLTVAIGGKAPFSDTAVDDQLFDVLSELRVEPSRTGFQEGIGGEDDCAVATPANPVCGVVILPQGASSSQVLLSLGPCGDTAYAGCGDDLGSVVQVLAGLDGYTATSPATILIKCDKVLCGGGSIQDQHLSYSLDGNGALTRAEACLSKGVVDPGPACVDYVQSKRDGSGDTYLYLLLTRDARVSVG